MPHVDYRLRLEGSRAVIEIYTEQDYKKISIDLACIANTIRELGLEDLFTGFDILSAVLTVLLASARYAEKMGVVEGVCIDYVLREWCSFDPDLARLLSGGIAMMLYGLVKHVTGPSSELLIRLTERIRSCVHVNT